MQTKASKFIFRRNGDLVVHVSHNDLDGVGAVIIGKVRYGQTNAVCCDYGTVDEVVLGMVEDINASGLPYEKVTFLVSDIGIKSTTAEVLDCCFRNGMNVILNDHHITNGWLNIYDWAKVVPEVHCGASLLYETLGKPTKHGDNYDDFVMLVRDYDLWIHNDSRSADLNRLLFLIGRERFIERFTAEADVYFTPREELVIDMDKEREDGYLKKLDNSLAIYTDGSGVSFGIVPCDQYISSMGHRLLERHPEIEYIVLVDVIGNKASIRSRTHQVADIASKFGGGGHPVAAGFRMDFRDVCDNLAYKVYKATA